VSSSRPGGGSYRRSKLLAMFALLGVLATFLPGSASAVDGSEVHAGEVRRLYLAYFDREPDAGGAAYWLAKRQAGLTLPAISSYFSHSPEFVARYGTLTDEEFVALVYRSVMRREPDSAGLAYWRQRMAEGMSRGSLMAHFSESAEFRQATGSLSVETPNRGRPASPDTSSGGAVGGGGGGGGSAPPTTTTTAPATTTTAPATTTTIAPTTTTTAPAPAPSTPTSGQIADIPSNFAVNDWLMNAWGPPDPGYPAFRTFCQFSHLAYADPIVAPGNDRFAHLHMFFGNTQANHTSTYQTLRTSGGGTCDGGPLNRTAYWMPAVFDGQDRVVVPNYFLIYYKAENAHAHGAGLAVQAPPNGLRMIAGARMDGASVDRSAQTPSGAGLTWGWSGCGSSQGRIGDCAPGQQLSAWVRFPYCWDGKNLDSPDHRSHLAYGTNNTWGPCPSSHPVHLAEITEFAYFESPTGTAQWYLSSDRMNPSSPAPNGSTFHADWFGAWDNPIQQRWLVNCLHGNNSTSNGNLCDGKQLAQLPKYSGPMRLTGWRPSP
jgi:hypothetical protein